MKNLFSVTAIIIALVITLGLFIFQKRYSSFKTGDHSYNSYNLPVNDTGFGTLFSSLTISDSVPHYVYQKAEDSLKTITDQRDFTNKGIGAGISNEYIGVVATEDLSKSGFFTKNQLNRDSNYYIMNYYFAIKNYDLDYPNNFFIKNYTYNLVYAKLDTIIQLGNKQTATNYHFEHKQIPFRYGTANKTILIPITSQHCYFLHKSILISNWIFYALLLYFFIGLPIKLLINISKGNAFIQQNISYLKTMSFAAFTYFAVTIAFVLIIRLMFNHLIPNEFHPQPFSQIVTDNFIFFLTGIGLFVVAKAFERGRILQIEQDLTI